MTIASRISAFCSEYWLKLPLIMAPMSGACPPSLAAAVANAGGMGAAGVLLDEPEGIAQWTRDFQRLAPGGMVQLNVWVPDPPVDAPTIVDAARSMFANFGRPGDAVAAWPAFSEQCEAMLAAEPRVISSIMGLFDTEYVRRIHDAGLAWFACSTTVGEALAAEDAGADAVVAQGIEAGGHRGTFRPEDADAIDTSLIALIPQIVDRVEVPVIATGGIADGRTMAAALALGASAVQIGTALLRTPEAGIDPAWAEHLAELRPDETLLTRAYSGRLGRAATTPFLRAWTSPDAPAPAPHPLQRALLTQWRRGEPEGLEPANHWAGQNAALSSTAPAGEVLSRMWEEARSLLRLNATGAFVSEASHVSS